MGIFGSMLGWDQEAKAKKEAEDEERRQYIHETVARFHETTANNYYRQQIIKENQERSRKGQPKIPVPPGDYR